MVAWPKLLRFRVRWNKFITDGDSAGDDHDDDSVEWECSSFHLSISELSLSEAIKASIGEARSTGSEAKHQHG